MAIKKTVQEKITWLKTLCSKMIDQPVEVSFGPHKTTAILVDITNKAVTKFNNAPEKRLREGKPYTPVLLTLKFAGNLELYRNDGTTEFELVFVDEDVTWAAITNGIRATLQGYHVDMRLVTGKK